MVNNNSNKVPNIPIGLDVALSQNIDATDYFGSLSEDEQQKVINHTHTMHSSQDTQNYTWEMKKFLKYSEKPAS